MDVEKNGRWPEFEALSELVLEKVAPRLLEPLQSEGRSIKLCLAIGDCWDGNTTTDMETGEPFVFDAGSFYGHNEYDTGNWRAPRHQLSKKVFVRNYKRRFAASEPGESGDDWDGRNSLYSLRFNTAHSIVMLGGGQREAERFGATEPFSLTIAGDRYYVITSPAETRPFFALTHLLEGLEHDEGKS
ncbi:uncharacterized protein BDV17DRAFT_293432 [Aspergillus undulatus]|uniref:uncharacterized protein n=1 Tax=Aspergillus undulatus TaxID=1810928 RepID=UPI003CCDE9C8